jgi:hypothetical protein
MRGEEMRQGARGGKGHCNLSSVEFLGEISDVLHSHAPLPLIPPTPFSHEGRWESLGILMAEMGDGTQGLAKKLTPVRTRQRRDVGS